MIVYVVELEMAIALREEYLAWLREHVAAMLALPGFLDAEILECREPPPASGHWAVAVHYRLRDRAAWDAYLADHAAGMRAAGPRRFGGRQVRATRRLLEAL